MWCRSIQEFIDQNHLGIAVLVLTSHDYKTEIYLKTKTETRYTGAWQWHHGPVWKKFAGPTIKLKYLLFYMPSFSRDSPYFKNCGLL